MSEWPGKIHYRYFPYFNHCISSLSDFLRKFKPTITAKRPVGRPRKTSKAIVTVLPSVAEKDKDVVVISDDSGEEDERPSDDSTNLEPAPKKKRGQYRSYSLQFKTSVILQLAHTPVGVLSERYNIPQSTIFSWEQQMRMMNKKVAGTVVTEVHIFVPEVGNSYRIQSRWVKKY